MNIWNTRIINKLRWTFGTIATLHDITACIINKLKWTFGIIATWHNKAHYSFVRNASLWCRTCWMTSRTRTGLSSLSWHISPVTNQVVIIHESPFPDGGNNRTRVRQCDQQFLPYEHVDQTNQLASVLSTFKLSFRRVLLSVSVARHSL